MEDRDLIDPRHVQRETRFLVEHVPLKRSIAEQRHFPFQGLSFERQLLKTRLTLGLLGCKHLRRLQPQRTVHAMIAEIGNESDRDERNDDAAEMPLTVMLGPHGNTLIRNTEFTVGPRY